MTLDVESIASTNPWNRSDDEDEMVIKFGVGAQFQLEYSDTFREYETNYVSSAIPC